MRNEKAARCAVPWPHTFSCSQKRIRVLVVTENEPTSSVLRAQVYRIGGDGTTKELFIFCVFLQRWAPCCHCWVFGANREQACCMHTLDGGGALLNELPKVERMAHLQPIHYRCFHICTSSLLASNSRFDGCERTEVVKTSHLLSLLVA